MKRNRMVNIRYAAKEDAPELVTLIEELGYPSDEKIIRDRLSKIAERNGRVIVAAGNKKELLGCIHVLVDLRLAEGESGEIVSLVVRKNARGQGIGKLLVDKAKKWFAANGFRNVRIRANSLRKEAHQFYQHQGFKEIKSQKVLQFQLNPGD